MKTLKIFVLGISLLIFPLSSFADSPKGNYQTWNRNTWSGTAQNYGNSWSRDVGNYDYRHGYSHLRERHRIAPNYNYGRNLIARGVRSGELSPKEVRDLQRAKEQLAKKEFAYRRDGRLTDRERDSLQDLREDYYDNLQHNLNDGERSAYFDNVRDSRYRNDYYNNNYYQNRGRLGFGSGYGK